MPLDFQTISAIIFYSLIFLVLYLNRKKFDVHCKFIFLYRTKIGINLMNSVSKKAPRLIKFLGYFGVIIGFIGMVFTLAMILFLTYKLLIFLLSLLVYHLPFDIRFQNIYHKYLLYLV